LARHRQRAWSFLRKAEPLADIALVQEAVPPDEAGDVRTVPPRDGDWTTLGGRRTFCAAVACLDSSLEFVPLTTVPLTEGRDDAIPASLRGTLAAARVSIDGEDPITVVSVYSAWERPISGSWIYADASAHRLVSDLSYFAATQKDQRLIIAGDWNILRGYGENANAYWGSRYDTVFSRMKTIGIPLIGPEHPHGRQADPWPAEMPRDSLAVPTFSASGAAERGTRQLDFAFASASLKDRLRVRALNAPEEWGPSDHCRLLIELY